MKKICTKCNLEKDFSEYHKHRLGQYGLDPKCKKCTYANTRKYQLTHKVEMAAHSKRYREKNVLTYKRIARETKYKANYSITIKDYEDMLKRQNYKCAICSSVKSQGVSEHFYVDHNHSTGKVRALLCNPCNAGLGKFRDNELLLKKALKYLKYHNKKEADLEKEIAFLN